MQDKWWKSSVVYQVYPRSFMDSNGDGIGDIRGIIERLDYLDYLGIDVIWLSPIYESPNDDNGYDISDYQKIMKEFGTMDDFDELLDKCHELDIKIMLDLVVNHTSDEHPWFIESKSNENSPYRDFYLWKGNEKEALPNNWGSAFGGSTWEYDKPSNEYYLHLYSVKQPDLNWENPKMRQAIYDMMTWWLDKGVDGFRMDVINLIAKDPSYPDGQLIGQQYGDFYPVVTRNTKVHDYLKEMYREVLGKYDIITVGEMPEVTVEEAKRYTLEENQELNMVFNFEHMACDAGELGRWSNEKLYLPDLKTVMTKWQKGLENGGWNSLYWNNHDQPRVVSRFGDDKEFRVKSAKMLGACLHFLKGTPYIYQGEELGMTNIKLTLDEYKDIDTINSYYHYVHNEGVPAYDMMGYIHRKSRDNARTPMQWDDSLMAGFTTAEPWMKVNPNYKEINVKNQIDDPLSILNFYKKLIKLRKEMPIIVDGVYSLLEPDDESLYVYERQLDKEKLLIVCNFTSNEVSYTLPNKGWSEGNILISNYTDVRKSSITQQHMVVLPYEVIVLHSKA